MRKSLLLAALALSTPVPGRALVPLAEAARLNIGADRLIVGRIAERPDELLDCAKSEVQHTIRLCALKPNALLSAFSVGRRVQSASLTVNFKGAVINMSLAFDTALGFDVLLGDYKAALASSPKIQYWADDKHLYASCIWIDGDSEIELSRTLKGPAEGGPVRVYVSSLSGNQDLSPEDAGN